MPKGITKRRKKSADIRGLLRKNQRSRMCSIRNLTKLFAKRGKVNQRENQARKPFKNGCQQHVISQYRFSAGFFIF